MKIFWTSATVTSVLFLAACGGGSGGDEVPTSVTLQVELTDRGTYVQCDSPARTTLTLRRTRAQAITTQPLTCPNSTMLGGDYDPSSWEAVFDQGGNPVIVAQADTLLPRPIVLTGQGETTSLPPPAPLNSTLSALRLQALDAELRPLTDSDLAGMQAAGTRPALWQWVSLINGKSYHSAPSKSIDFAEKDLGFWGALAMGDSAGDARSELLGTVTTSEGTGIVGYDELGLTTLWTGRVFRDIRFADLLNRGMQDIISNVYGGGCIMIGFRREAGGYDFITPRRSDGSCITGHGETILVADFDGDGFTDIVLPSYERFDLLKNHGNGTFTEIADAAGIASPNYLPRVEGAAAVDIDLNGTVDIVIASEVFMNDGSGHFTPLPSPFGASRIFDEGMAVADLDGDGFFDIVKHDPSLGPRVFWGRASRTQFDDGSWLLGGTAQLRSSFGLGVGRYTGNQYLDIVFAGGAGVAGGPGNGVPPNLCVQSQPRQFQCLPDVFPVHAGAWSDLVMVTDIDEDGSEELVSRYGPIRIFSGAPAPGRVFRIDLRNAAGVRNQFGRSIIATCSTDGSSLGLRFVDGGNGFMAQTSYIVPFTSSWCPSIFVDVATPTGVQRFGPLLPGTHQLKSGA